MRWHTPVSVETIHSSFKINHSAPIISIGSCFATNISTRLNQLLFQTEVNPLGISFNPISIADALHFVIEKKQFTSNELFFDGEIYHSWYHHSSFSGTIGEAVLEKINKAIQNAHEILMRASTLILTLGSAQVFTLKEHNIVVNNCHKAPSALFNSDILKTETILKHLEEAIQKVRLLNPNIEIILTVSPVRHTKMGLIENAKSKAQLIVAADALCEKISNVQYFPAYEIMMDDLRDYRFYNADLIHPTEQAIDYIFDIFQKTYFTDKTQIIVAEIKKINAMQAHRPQFKNTIAAQGLQKNIEAQILAFQKKYPEILWRDGQFWQSS